MTLPNPYLRSATVLFDNTLNKTTDIHREVATPIAIFGATACFSPFSATLLTLVRVLSRDFCLGEKLRRGHSPRRQTSGRSGGSPPENVEFQIARDTIQSNIMFMFS